MRNEVFDFKKALEYLKKGKPLSGKVGILTPLFFCKKVNLNHWKLHLDYHLNNNSEEGNRLNGKSSEMMKFISTHFYLKLTQFLHEYKVPGLYVQAKRPTLRNLKQK